MFWMLKLVPQNDLQGLVTPTPFVMMFGLRCRLNSRFKWNLDNEKSQQTGMIQNPEE